MWDCIGYQGECTTSTPAPTSPLHPLTCSSDKMVKELKERLLKAKGNPSFLEGVQDINVVCGVLKDLARGRVPMCGGVICTTLSLHFQFLRVPSLGLVSLQGFLHQEPLFLPSEWFMCTSVQT